MDNDNNKIHKQQVDDDYDYDNGFHPKEVHLKPNYKLYRTGFFFKLINKFLVLLFKFFQFFPKFFVWGFKFKGKKYRKYAKGAIILCNHVHPFDAFNNITAFWNKRLYCTTLQSNLGFPFVSGIFRLGGAVPIPEDPNLFKRFLKETPEMLKKGYNVIVYPEAKLIPFSDHVRDFHPGAFHFAVGGTDTILLLVTTFHKPKGFYKLVRRNKPCMHINLLEPYKIQDMGNRKATIKKAMEDTHRIMSEYFIENSDWFKE